MAKTGMESCGHEDKDKSTAMWPLDLFTSVKSHLFLEISLFKNITHHLLRPFDYFILNHTDSILGEYPIDNSFGVPPVTCLLVFPPVRL